MKWNDPPRDSIQQTIAHITTIHALIVFQSKLLETRGAPAHHHHDIVHFQWPAPLSHPIAATVHSFSSALCHPNIPPQVLFFGFTCAALLSLPTAPTAWSTQVRRAALPPCPLLLSLFRVPRAPLPPTHSCRMPLNIVGKLISVSDPRFTRVHKSYSEKRERFHRANIYATMFGHVDGIEDLIQFQRSQQAYVIFNLLRTGLRTKKR